MKKAILSLFFAVVLLAAAASAHALSYDSGDITLLKAGESATFSFLPAPADFTSAKLSLDVAKLTNATSSIGGKGLSSPASGEFFAFTGSTLTYLFTTDFHLGRNMFKLDNFLGQLNSANSPSGLMLGLLMDRGSIGFDNVHLRGAVAPEPISMALMGAGIVGLPFARRLRKAIKG